MFCKIVLLLCVAKVCVVLSATSDINDSETVIIDDRASVSDEKLPGNVRLDVDQMKTVSTEQVEPIVSTMLAPINELIQPLLGPLAPLADVLAPIITNQVAELITTFLNETVASATLDDLTEVKGYRTYTVMIPQRGRYVLLSKPKITSPLMTTQKPVTSTTEITLEDRIDGTLDEFLARRSSIEPLFGEQKPIDKLKKKFYKKKSTALNQH